MKAIINGLRYDTDKAIRVGGCDNPHVESVTDFSYWSADLYMTPRSHRYFIAGEGGPMTMFRTTTGQNSWSSGAKIIPMSKKEAFEWAETYLNSDIVEKHFGDLIQDA